MNNKNTNSTKSTESKKHKLVKNSLIVILLLAMGATCGYAINQHKAHNQYDKQEIQTDTNSYIQSDYFKKHELNPSIKKEKLFNLADEPYYVLFRMEECPYCKEVDNVMMNYINREQSLPVYTYDCASIGIKTEIQWNEDDVFNETVTPENFSIQGTPTLLKVDGEKYSTFIGAENIKNELKLK